MIEIDAELSAELTNAARRARRGRASGSGTSNVIGGETIGTAGGAGTIYEGYKLAAGEEFATLDIYTPTNATGKYIASHRRRGRRAINSGANDYYWTPEHTGHLDSNRGFAIGSSVNDLISVTSSVLKMSTRLATTLEKNLAWTTSASTGPQRPQSASALHSAGYQAAKWPFVIDARMKIPTGAQLPAGGWPAFWMENVLPTWANTGEFDFEWVDNGDLYNNFITGNSSNDAIGSVVVDNSDGLWHTFSMVVTAATIKFYKDGTLLTTAVKRPDAHVTGPMFWWFRIGVDLTPGIYGMTYSAAAWTGITASMEIDYVRVWTTPTATDLGYKGATTVTVDFTGSISETLPSKATLWGAASGSVTEYLIFQPIEGAEPGISEVPLTGAPNTWYGDAAPVGSLWGPNAFTWNPTTRALTGTGFDQAGRIMGNIVAWDDTNGGLAGFHRVIVNVGPKVNLNDTAITTGASVSIDVYALCDCGMLVTDASGQRAKTISVTGLGSSGLSYNDTTGLITGTAVAGVYSVTVNTTNSIGQSASATKTFTVAAAPASYAYESWTGPGWFDASDVATLTLSGSNVTAMANKRSGGGDLTGAGTAAGRTSVAAAQNGRNAIRVARDVSTVTSMPRLSAGTSALVSTMCQGDDKPYTMIVAYKPTDTNTGFVSGWSDTLPSPNFEAITLISRSTPNCSMRRQLTAAAGSNDVNFGTGQASGSPCIVAVKHTGTAVSIWDTSTTAVVSGTAQDTGTFNAEVAFHLFAAETASSTDPSFSQVQRNMDFYECVIVDSAMSDADIQQAISDLATKWAITLT